MGLSIMNNLMLRLRVLQSVLLAFLATIIANAFSGIVGNAADGAFRQIFPRFIREIDSIKFSLFTGFLICLIFIVIIFFLHDELKQLEKITKDFDNLDKQLNLIMHRFHAQITNNSNLINDIEKLNDDFLHIIKTFLELNYEVHQLTLFLLDTSTNETLFVSNAIPPIPQESYKQLRCYFGKENQNNSRGMAGLALHDRNIIKVRLETENNSLQIYPKGKESGHYIVLNENLQLRYKLSVAIPILIEEEQMGVLCLDTYNKNTDLHFKKNDILFDRIAQRVLILIQIVTAYKTRI